MNERAFIKSCIKVAGLLLLIWGMIGLTTSAIAYGGGTVQKHLSEKRMERADDDTQVKTSVIMIQAYQRMATVAMMNIPAHIVQILVGLYLCRRYNRLLEWLLKDEPTL